LKGERNFIFHHEKGGGDWGGRTKDMDGWRHVKDLQGVAKKQVEIDG